jgi:PHP family Zn ribbon phosphoesterase
MIQDFLKQEADADQFLHSRFKDKDGGAAFVEACSKALKLKGKDLVWFCGMVDNYHYHYHQSYDPSTLVRTRRHFKKIALRFLNEGDYKSFKNWINNWRDILIVTNYLAPDLWERYEATERLSD